MLYGTTSVLPLTLYTIGDLSAGGNFGENAESVETYLQEYQGRVVRVRVRVRG